MMIKKQGSIGSQRQQQSNRSKPTKGKQHYVQSNTIPLVQSPSSKRIRLKQQHRPNDSYDPKQCSISHSHISKHMLSRSSVKSEQTIEMHQKLKNLHLFYKTKIQEEKAQTVQRNSVFLGIIEQMQKNHEEKVADLKKRIEQAEGEKKDVGLVDQRMNQIKGSIDEILKQSSQLKQSNDALERKINQKQHQLREREQQLSRLKEELMESRTELQSFERLNLKQNKRNKDLISMIDKTVYSNHQG